jgi:hypothetical protein
MEAPRFDRLSCAFAGASRRRLLRSLSALAAIALPGGAQARKRKGKKKRKKVTRNGFGCVNVDRSCQNDGQCCSGICRGKQGKKRCRGHDGGDCQAGQREEACGGTEVFCTSSAGEFGICNTTTGNAPYCAVGAGCFPCAKDADCQAVCGAAAACIVCLDACAEDGGTACVAPSDASCAFPPT